MACKFFFRETFGHQIINCCVYVTYSIYMYSENNIVNHIENKDEKQVCL